MSASAPRPMEQGKHGLWYLTDPAFPGMFVVGRTPDEATQLSSQAALALQDALPSVDHHDLFLFGPQEVMVTVPKPEWQTPDQREESVERLGRHIREHVMS